MNFVNNEPLTLNSYAQRQALVISLVPFYAWSSHIPYGDSTDILFIFQLLYLVVAFLINFVNCPDFLKDGS